jgi:hypothetical protein
MAGPLYTRALRLRHLRPGPVLRLLYLEGAVLVAGLAALAELASWWGVLVLPAVVAALVKVEDVATGYRRARVTGAAPATPAPATVGRARPLTPALPAPAAGAPWSQPQLLRVRRPGAHRALADTDRVWARAAVPQTATPHHSSQR